jgi:hypothetical protein
MTPGLANFHGKLKLRGTLRAILFPELDLLALKLGQLRPSGLQKPLSPER